MEREMLKADELEPSVETDSVTADGRFVCQVQTFQNKRDHFKIQVKRLLLNNDGIEAATGPADGRENRSQNSEHGLPLRQPRGDVLQPEVICLDCN